jgi:phosphoglycerate dehydrogenase-like enzyme
MRVHFQSEPDASLFNTLDPAVQVTHGAPPADAYSVLVAGRPAPELLTDSVTTQIIPFAGVPAATLETMRARPTIAVHNLHHNAPATAELAIALLLAAAKSVVPVDRRFRGGDWSDRGQMDRAMQLDGRNALVLGNGAIGQRVARACAGLGMTVDVIARRPRDGYHGPEALRILLPRAQALMVCLPATARTEGMIGEAELALLPSDAILVNIARGPIVAEGALFEALKAGRIFGAGLDVWWRYPESRDAWASTPPSTLPFHELDNVVLSPHRGGHVKDTEAQRMRALAELLNAAAHGDALPNRVDLDAGY